MRINQWLGFSLFVDLEKSIERDLKEFQDGTVSEPYNKVANQWLAPT